MLLAFVDESYNKRLFCLTSLVADAQAIMEVSDALNTTSRSIAAHGYPEAKEFHGHEIFQAVGGWRRVPLRVAHERLFASSSGRTV